jgi:hypothetical protein
MQNKIQSAYIVPLIYNYKLGRDLKYQDINCMKPRVNIPFLL